MGREIPSRLVEHLIEIGMADRVIGLDDLFAQFPDLRDGAFMRRGWEPWHDVASSLRSDQLIALIKALTLVEKLPNCSSGSVSPVILLFRKLSERAGDQALHLANWILAQSDNPYLPFGRFNFGAKSLAQLQQLSKEFEDSKRARQSAEQARQQEARCRKAFTATQNLFGALRRRDERAVVALLQRGADLKATDSEGRTAIDVAKSVGLAHLVGDKSETARS
ncbi:MAG: hypothetical protein FJW38_31160 [Acidobacteria bacterium]|nr:hypothetical protein [Acidobacteriota bacterium]